MIFKRITPCDYPALKRFFKGQRRRLSAYSLASILVWSNKVYQPHGAVDGDTLHLSIEFKGDGALSHLMLPVSSARQFSPDQLHDFAVESGYSRYCFVPEDYVTDENRQAVERYFTVEELPEYSDYVYFVTDLAELKGKKYAKKRNLIKQFQKQYVDTGRVRIQAITPSNASACIDFLEEWCKERDCDANPEEDLACEKLAVIHTMENFGILEVKGLLLRVDDVVSAFGVTTHLTDDMAVLHFEKAFSHVKGLYQYFDKVCAEGLLKGYTYVNKENDMGIPGLAKAKKSYYPAEMIKSYQLTLRRDPS